MEAVLKYFDKKVSRRQIDVLTVAFIIVMSFFPSFINIPYNINIFLAWEGAYRIYLGQMPSIDFYLPMGFIFWLLPAFFFKIFGPGLHTLIIFQSFVNLITYLAFRKILVLLKVERTVVFLSLLVLGISYVLLNFWPWYNNFVFVLQLISIVFFLKYRQADTKAFRFLYLFLTALFSVLAFFTKQDSGAFTIMLNVALVVLTSLKSKSFQQILIFILALIFFSLPLIVPFLSHDFQYWFNLGQKPHYSRLNLFDYLHVLLGSLDWVKLYAIAIFISLIVKFQNFNQLFSNEREYLFLFIVLGILVQASVIQVTSYIPHYNTYYLHAFSFAYIISSITGLQNKLAKAKVFLFMSALVMFLWSADLWKYSLKFARKLMPTAFFEAPQNVVSVNTWLKSDETQFDKKTNWRLSDLEGFRHIYLPEETIAGMDKIVKEYEGVENLKVLNMSELTPLAATIGYTPMVNQPLWYHKNVSIFEREIEVLCNRIKDHEYDLVLFEKIPILNNFYPQEIYDCLLENYKMKDEFRAPRREPDATVCVFEKE